MPKHRKSGPVALGPAPDPRAVVAYRLVRNDDLALDTAHEQLKRRGWTPLAAAVISEHPMSNNAMVALWAIPPESEVTS